MNMRRRDFLLSMGSVAIATVPRISVAKSTNLSVGVVGGGIVGASIALHLAQSGASVTVFERTLPASGATGNSFAWLNAGADNPHYRELRIQSLSAYHEIDKKLQLDITWGGYLAWKSEPGAAAELRAIALAVNRTEYPMRMLNAEGFAMVAPNLTPGPFETAVYAGMDGHLDPVHVTHMFLNQARKYGAQVLYPCEVTGLELSGDRLTGVSTTQGKFVLDRLVIAGGVDTPSITTKVDYVAPLKHSPGILAHSAPMAPSVRTVNYGEDVHFKQMSNGRIVAGDSTYAPDTPVHREILRERRDFPDEETRNTHGSRIIDKVAMVLPSARGAKLERLTLGFRPMPEDGYPIVGFVPDSSDVYVAVMHSGVTLAPIMGRMISREIFEDNSVEKLDRYRPERFSGSTSNLDVVAEGTSI
jgi:glycine/D-amino acid oxidase-like deaminating enzyme